MWDNISTKCLCSSDLYKARGLIDKFGIEIKSYAQLAINDATYNKIADMMAANARDDKKIKAKDIDAQIKKSFKYTTPTQRENMVRFDWMNYSPWGCDDIPDDMIYWSTDNIKNAYINGKKGELW